MFIVYSVVLSCDVWYEAQQRYASTVISQTQRRIIFSVKSVKSVPNEFSILNFPFKKASYPWNLPCDCRGVACCASKRHYTIEWQSTIYRICVLCFSSFYPVAFGMRRSSATPLQSLHNRIRRLNVNQQHNGYVYCVFRRFIL